MAPVIEAAKNLINDISSALNDIAAVSRYEKWRFNSGTIDQQKFDRKIARLHGEMAELLREYTEVAKYLAEQPPADVGAELHGRLTEYVARLKRKVN